MADELNPGPEPVEVDVDSLSHEQVTEQIESLKQGKPARLKRPVEETPEPKPAAEAKPAPEAGDDDDFKGQETVPHGTFHRANQRRKEAEEKLAKVEQERQVAFQRLSELLEAQQRQQAAQAEPEDEPDLGPDPEADPVGALKWQREQLAAQQRERAESARQAQQARQQEAYARNLKATADKTWDRVVTERPELKGADEAFITSVMKEWMATGRPEWQAMQDAQVLALRHADHCLRNNIDMGDYFAALAGARGWQPPKAIPGQELQPELPRDAQGRFTKEAEKMEALNAAKAAALSLGGGGSPARTGPITAQDIINMTPEEYAAFKDKVGEAGLTAAAHRRA